MIQRPNHVIVYARNYKELLLEKDKVLADSYNPSFFVYSVDIQTKNGQLKSVLYFNSAVVPETISINSLNAQIKRGKYLTEETPRGRKRARERANRYYAKKKRKEGKL